MSDWKQIKSTWDVKPRVYFLTGDATPPLRQIRSKHKHSNHLLHFDESKKEQRELRFIAGAKTPFVDEQPGENIIVQQIFFRDGMLRTKSTDIALQQFLALHPDNGRIFLEVKPEEQAENALDEFEVKGDAYGIIASLDADNIASLMFSQIGNEAFNTSTKELKRDLYVIANSEPSLIVSMNEDEHVYLRYIAQKAINFKVLTVDGGTVKWGKSKTKLMAIPVDQAPHQGLAAFFLTDDGVAVKAKVLELLDKL